MRGRSSSLDKIVSDVERTRAWFKGQSVLEKSQDRETIWRIWRIKDVRRHIVLEESKLGFLESAWKKMVLENDHLAEARRRVEEEQDAAIAATAVAAAVALVAAPSPSPLSLAPRRPIGQKVTSTSTKASPSPDAIKRDCQSFFGSQSGSAGRSFLTVQASEDEDVFSNYSIKQRQGRIPELPSARITSVLSLPHANIASSLVKHLLPNASNSSKHKKKITALETYLGHLMELFSSTVVPLSRVTEIIDFMVDASTQNPFPNADNHCLGPFPHFRPIPSLRPLSLSFSSIGSPPRTYHPSLSLSSLFTVSSFLFVPLSPLPLHPLSPLVPWFCIVLFPPLRLLLASFLFFHCLILSFS
ncbi:hypothetical protein BDY24DRAFT_390335, partial [Mrakia frigida]|uniref:uncharacterized protein n=1 Tax=Mrakia frigida TaxID=29902 RepID=UPI003FCC0A73